MHSLQLSFAPKCCCLLSLHVLDNEKDVDVVYLDFSKALDSVNHFPLWPMQSAKLEHRTGIP